MDYFDKYRGTVSGLKYAGWSASGLVFPAILAKLVDIYHVRGMLLILGALTMNVMPLILLFEYPAATMKCECLQKMTHFLTKGRDGAKFENEKEDARIRTPGIHAHAVGLGTTAVEHRSNSKQIMKKTLRLEYSLDCNVGHRDPCSKAVGGRASHARRSHGTKEVDAAILGCCKSISAITGESLAWHGQLYKATKQEYEEDATLQRSSSNVAEATLHQRTSFPSSKSSCVPAPSHLNVRTPLIGEEETASTKSGANLLQEIWILLRTPALYGISVTYVFFDYSHIVVMNNLVAYAVDKGSPLPLADSLIMYAAVSGVAGRLCLPLASDTLGLSRDVFVACNLLAMALCLALLAEVASHVLVTVLVVGESLAAGSVLSMKPVLVAEYVGVRMMTATWGVMGVLMVPLLLTGPLIVGFFRDGMGSFDNLYRLHSALNLFIALILFGLAFHRKIRANESAVEKK
ncbi:uncharacterized protein [Dermacentor andersoni]|uniref:uncharacterized protein n=1 Tax=Dermacentor andersoni TaxID=34620 RepID=UPI003B3BA24C